MFKAPEWTKLDDILARLASRTEHENGLEVQFRGYWGFGGLSEDEMNNYLPKFVGKGRMTVWYEDKPVYCSDRIRKGDFSS